MVVKCTADRQAQGVFGVDTAAADVGQLPQGELHLLLAGNRTSALVVQVVGRQQQRAVSQ